MQNNMQNNSNQVCVARKFDNIGINPSEYLLDDEGLLKLFPSVTDAKLYLKEAGFSEEDIYWMYFPPFDHVGQPVTKVLLKKTLLQVKEKALNGDYTVQSSTNFGICNKWKKELADHVSYPAVSYGLVQELCCQWPEFSGDINYPIKEDAVEPLWVGDNLVARLSLIDFLVEAVEDLPEDSNFLSKISALNPPKS